VYRCRVKPVFWKEAELAANSLSDKTLELVAERFRVLGDPVRLRLLQALEAGEKSVAELVEATGAGQANVSKHLQLLLRAGVVQRRREGLFSYYSIRDARVFQLCDVVCGSLAEHFTRELSELPRATRRGRRGR
jgi:DNA-binding transcriptional ArsR family regulator